MYTLRTWSRVLLVAFLLVVLSQHAIAARRTTSRTTEPTPTETAEEVERPQAGSPEFGVLIIVGAVGFLIFVAWVFSRVGEGNSSQADTSAD
jgi:hypothetical protein